MRAWLLLPLLALCACETGPTPAEQATLPLCAWGQLEHLQLRMVPDSAGLKPLVRDADLRWLEDALAAEQSQTDSENPLKALAQGLVESIAAMGRAVHEANSRHAKCETKLLSQTGDEAHVQVTRTIPDITPVDPKERSAQMAKLETHEQRVEALSKVMDEATTFKTETVEVTMRRQGDAWVIDYGLPEAAIAELEQEQVALMKRVEGFPAQAALLDKLVVTEATLVEQRDGLLRQSALKLGLRNELDQPVHAGVFVGTVTAGGAELGTREFDMDLPEVLAPGTEGKWVLNGNAFRGLGQLAKGQEGAEVTVKAVELRGPQEATIANVREQVHVEGEVARTKNEIARIQETYLKP
ncbi:MAG: hypothetical protein H6740_21145 [Alphaproteobacteria bacterium]|nr:hypothetical protein [Alphaproteobacteria bacterium]